MCLTQVHSCHLSGVDLLGQRISWVIWEKDKTKTEKKEIWSARGRSDYKRNELLSSEIVQPIKWCLIWNFGACDVFRCS